MKITENPDGTYTLDPGEDVRDLVAECTRLKAELRASREAHHETTNELRKLKQEQAEPEGLDLSWISTVVEGLVAGKGRKR